VNGRAAGWVFLLSGLFLISGRGAIVHVQIPESEQQFFALGEARTRDFDFDQDGRVDLQFIGSISGFAVRALHNESGILTASLVGEDFFGITAVPLLYGETIMEYREVPGEIPRGITPGGSPFYNYLLSYGVLDGSAGGIWFNQEAYMGFALFEPRIDGQFDRLHFGWLRLREFGGLGAFFLEYAYETEADVPVFAGQIPEPGVGVLLMVGGAVLLLRRGRRDPLKP